MTIRRLSVLGLLAATIGCGGTGGTLPVCAASDDREIEVAIVGADGKVLDAAVTARVAVAQIDSCADVTCPSSFSNLSPAYRAPSRAAKRIVLTEAGPRQWTLYFRNDHMPSSLIEVGEEFDLTVDATINTTGFWNVYQSVLLSRGEDLVAFARYGYQYSGPRIPDLSAFGVGIDVAASACLTVDSLGCTSTGSALAVTFTGENAVVGPGQTATIGQLSFTNGVFVTNTCGESTTATLIGGFRTP